MPAEPTKTSNLPYAILACVAVFVLVSGTSALLLNQPPNRSARIYAAVTNAISRQLKAPASARFIPSDQLAVVELAGGPATASGWVDSQNEYGALLRNSFRVEFSETPSAIAIRSVALTKF